MSDKNRISFIVALLILLYSGKVVAQYTQIPDPNFEQYLIAEGYDSELTLDGQILTADAQMVTDISPNGTSHDIADITGIEDFTSLEVLGIGNFRGTSIDLGVKPNLVFVQFPDSPFLEELDITECPNLETLWLDHCAFSQIDISNNLELRSLSVIFNPISSINLTLHTELIRLDCNGTLIQTLDLSNASNFRIIFAQDANLQYVDLRNGNNENVTIYDTRDNPDLSCVYVDDAVYSTANWTDVDPVTTFVESEAECDDLGITEISGSQSAIYPNPASDYFSISEVSTIDTLSIYNLNGSIVKTYKEATQQYDVSQLTRGMYFVVIHSEKFTEVVKLIIE